MTPLYTGWRSFVKSKASNNQLVRRVPLVPMAISGDNGPFSSFADSPLSCPRWSPRSVRWRPPHQKATTGKCWHPESQTQHVQPPSPGEAFGIYTPGSVGPGDHPATGNESTTYGIGVIARLHALDLSCSDGSRSRGPRRCSCVKLDSIYRMPQIPNC